MIHTMRCGCGRQLLVEEKLAGRKGRCPGCGQELEITAQEAATPLGTAEAALPVAETIPDENEFAKTAWTALEDAGPPGKKVARLYSPRTVAGAAFLGGPLAGWLAIADNYFQLQSRTAAWAAALLGLGLTGVLLSWCAQLARAGWLALSFLPLVFLVQLAATAVVMLGVARLLHGRAFAQLREQGGKPGSWKNLAGVALLCGLLLFLIEGAIIHGFSWNGPDGVLEFGRHDQLLTYRDGVTEDEARQCGLLLEQAGYFDLTTPKNVMLSKNGNGYVATFYMPHRVWDEPAVVAFYQDLQRTLSQQALGGQPIEFRLYDRFWRHQKTMP